MFLNLCLGSFSQDKSIAKVHYQFKHVNDSTQPDKHLSDEVVTYLGTFSSYYTSYSSARMSEQIDAQLSSPTFDGNLIIKGNGTAIKETYLVDFNKSSLEIIKKVGLVNFYLPGVFPEQDWQIEEDTKIIGGYSCQKATTRFKGRNYEAWFCPEIPMPYGPWKLHGLPGLILSAKDEKDEVVFEYAGFDRMEEDKSLIIAISPDAKISTEEELETLEKALSENRSAVIQAQQAATRSDSGTALSSAKSGVGTVYRTPGGMGSLDPSKIKSMTINKETTDKSSTVTNNPIELTK